MTTELELCSQTYEDGFEYRSFGTTIINTCNIDLSKYFSRNSTMYFYELFMMDPTTNKLIDIPLMIDNIPNPKASGVVNNMNNATEPINWILTRRFFIFDNLSGIQDVGGFIGGKVTTKTIRFPKLFKLIVRLQQTSNAKIYIPYMEIFYKAQSIDFINNGKTYTKINFISEYTMSIQGTIDAANGIFITLNILVGIVVCVKMYIWNKLNPQQLSPVI
jgi:hypothetical protein